MEIRSVSSSDADSIAAIYNHYISTSVVTFEEEEVPTVEMAARIEDVRSSLLPWYVAVDDGTTVGYAYATPWRVRSAYRYSVEVTAYVAPDCLGRGIGNTLYRQLIPALRERGIHTALAGIALPNARSIALHELFGFCKAAHLSQVGFKMKQWVDVGYWQLIVDPAESDKKYALISRQLPTEQTTKGFAE